MNVYIKQINMQITLLPLCSNCK